MSSKTVLTLVLRDLEERLAQYKTLLCQKERTAEDIHKTERRVVLLKELLELEGVDADALLEQVTH